MKNFLTSFAILFLSSQLLFGQEILNINNTLYWHNPAISGIKADINFLSQYFNSGTIFLGHVKKYNGYFDNYRFNVDGRIPLFNERRQLNLAAGVAYERDNIGALTENNWTFSFANHFKFKSESKLSVALGYTNHKIFFDDSHAVFPDGNSYDQLIVPNYTVVHNRFSLGSFFESSDRTFIAGVGLSTEEQNINRYNRINVTLGKAFSIGKQMTFSVNTFNEYRIREKYWLFEVPVKMYYKESFYVGSSFAFKQYISVLLGARISTKKAGAIELGGGYIEPLSKLASQFGRGFQINLNYYFTKAEKNQTFSYF